MVMFNENISIASIMEVGESDVVLDCNGKEYIIELNEADRKIIHDELTNEGAFYVAFDLNKKEILLSFDSGWIEESMPELINSEIEGGEED